MSKYDDLQQALNNLKNQITDSNAKLDQLQGLISETIIVFEQREKSLARIVNEINSMKILVDAHQQSIVYTEQTLGIYGDAYKVNRDSIEDLQKRVLKLEIKNGLRAPHDLH